MKYLNFLLFCVLPLMSCSESDILSKSDLWSLASTEDANIEILLPDSMNEGIKCSDYGPGCMAGFTVKVKNLKMICVEFKDTASAREEALRIDQYYLKNWVFDDVAGEPKLERYIQKLKGIRPLPMTPTASPEN